MYLVSTPSHQPLAAFNDWNDAENYLCKLENVSLKFTTFEKVGKNSAMYRLYVESAVPIEEYPEKTLGYITEGIQINPTK